MGQKTTVLSAFKRYIWPDTLNLAQVDQLSHLKWDTGHLVSLSPSPLPVPSNHLLELSSPPLPRAPCLQSPALSLPVERP